MFGPLDKMFDFNHDGKLNNGLWKLLIDNNMKKMDLVERVGISSSTLAKMSKGEIVSLTVLEKICDELNCDFGDLISYDRKGAKK